MGQDGALTQPMALCRAKTGRWQAFAHDGAPDLPVMLPAVTGQPCTAACEMGYMQLVIVATRPIGRVAELSQCRSNGVFVLGPEVIIEYVDGKLA